MKKNIIQKTFFDLQYNGPVNAFDLQKKINEWVNQELVSSIGQVLEKMDTGDAIIKIDRLELDIETMGSKNWENDIVIKLTDQLSRQLAEKQKLAKNADETIIQKDTKGNFFGAFVFFLQNGQLPWWSDIKGKEDFFEKLNDQSATVLPMDIKKELRKILADAGTRQRMSLQLPDRIFYSLYRELTADSMLTASERGLDDITKALSNEKEVKQLWKHTLLESLVKEEYDDKRIIDRFVSLSANKVHTAILQQLSERAEHPYLKNRANAEIARIKNEIEVNDEAGHSSDRGDENKIDRVVPGIAEGEYIGNAGLVIVAGFLPLFFTKLSVLNGNSLVDENKAAMLVQYLASGNENIAEFELGLARTLCGIDREQPVDTSLLLTEQERAEANDLLLSVIEYWSILKDTSVQGLRESFLLRKGILRFKGSEYLLQAEQKPYDMLLQNLPWNISMIKLPWMKNMLRTEWV